MGGSQVRSSNDGSFPSVAELLEFTEDLWEELLGSEDVFPEDPFGLDLSNDPAHLEEESASAPFKPCSLSGEREVLARASASDAIHDATPRLSVEGADIRENRRWVQGAVFHARRQDFAGEAFPLHMKDCASISNRSMDSEPESAAAGKKLRNIEGVSHTQTLHVHEP